MTAHRAHPDADALDGDRMRLEPEDFIGLGGSLPLLTTLAIAQILVDPGDETSCQRHVKVSSGKPFARKSRAHGPVDIENAGSRVLQ